MKIFLFALMAACGLFAEAFSALFVVHLNYPEITTTSDAASSPNDVWVSSAPGVSYTDEGGFLDGGDNTFYPYGRRRCMTEDDSRITVMFENKEGPLQKATLGLTHMFGPTRGVPDYPSITIEVNDKVIVSAFSAYWFPWPPAYWSNAYFDITDALLPGQNSISVSFDHGKKSGYSIESISINLEPRAS